MDQWLSWGEIARAAGQREIVLFGAAEFWIDRTLARLARRPGFIVDNSASDRRRTVRGLEVAAPATIHGRAARYYVVVTAGSYDSIVDELLANGFAAGRDFVCSPALADLKVITDIRDHAARLLITAQDHGFYKDAGGSAGGGIYVFDTATGALEKMLAGNFRQISETGDHYFAVDELAGPMVVGKDFRVLERFGQAEMAKPCGIDWCAERGLVFVANVYRDVISAYDARTLKLAFETPVSIPPKRTEHAHHINDLCVKDGFVYVSMFSLAGAMPQWAFDAGILQIDIDAPERRWPIRLDGVWMPHSVGFINDELSFLDSMNGRVYRNMRHCVATMPGFLRGLAFDGTYYYVGQSEYRYFDRIKHVRDFTMLNPGFYLYHPDSRAGTFHSLPGLRQLHDILVLETGR